MRLPNNYGSVYKLSGKRRKPWCARVTVSVEYDKEKDNYTQKKKLIGSYATKAEALEALAKYNNSPTSVSNETTTVKDLYESIKSDMKVSDDRKAVYERLFKNYFDPIASMKIKDVKTANLQQIIDDCEKGYSTKSNLRALMHQILGYAAKNDIIAKDYTDYVVFEKEETILERQVYTDDEIKKIWEKKDLDEYAITLVLLHQGMRIKEFMDMMTDDVDYDAMTIHIPKAKNKQSIRSIPINPVVLPLLKMLEEHSANGRFTTMNAKSYQYFVTSVLNHRAYDARHTFATKCNQLDMKTFVIQRLMGHKPDTLLENTYTHLTIEELAEEIRKVRW